MELTEFESRLKAALESLKNELQTLRANRPSPKMVEDIMVEHYGEKMTVKQLGSISIIPPREINISVWDKSVVPAIAKAIETSNLKLPASVDGNVIHVNLPQLSEERKKELEKVVRKVVEETRIRVRMGRDEANKEVKKLEDGDALSEDAAKKKKEEIQKKVDTTNKEIEELLERKVKEIFE
ncbi:MAG: ribosome recycling factor [bacterium]|nr:ribosome recycling factor [bacterium]